MQKGNPGQHNPNVNPSNPNPNKFKQGEQGQPDKSGQNPGREQR